MIWKLPNEDDVRYVKRFALWPTEVKNNKEGSYRVWLEPYMARQTYWKNKIDDLIWVTRERLTMDAYNERAKYNQLFETKTGVKYNAETVQDILNNMDYNANKL